MTEQPQELTEEQEEFASTRFWKSPNTLDAEVPPAQGASADDNVRRIHAIAEGEPDETAHEPPRQS